VKRRIALVLTLAGLCALAGEYAGDMRAQAAEQIACQIRYHGGPKSDATRTTNCASAGKSA
jgi:hypothetical protein